MPSLDHPVARAIEALASGRRPGETLTAEAFGQLMRGDATPAQTAALLMGLRVLGETAEELAGAARALRAAMIQLEPRERAHLVDTCGTGGGRVSTFNISTAAALVVVAAGARVAKHGNRSYTSRCGSADVIEALGIAASLGQEDALEMLDQTGMTFLFAPLYHPAMRFVAPVRRELAVGTIMNVVGPIANPAGVDRQVVGVADRDRARIVAEALLRLGTEHALVVHGLVGMDEISPSGPSDIWEVRDNTVQNWTLDPADYGLEPQEVRRLAGGEPRLNAERIERLVADPAQDPAGCIAVTLNAGAALYVAGLAQDVRDGIELASGALVGGGAADVLERLRRASGAALSISAERPPPPPG